MQEMNEKSGNESKMGLLGDYLKQRRTDKHYTLEKFSQKTKISINILKSLETDAYAHLPSAAYIKGFVQSYVKVLGLPQDEVINKMEYTYLNVLGKPFPALNHTKLMTRPSPTKEEEQTPDEVIESGDSIISNTRSILPVLIFSGVILLFAGGYKLVSSIVDSEVNSKKTRDLGPKIESSSALVNPTVKVRPPVEQTPAVTAEVKTEPATVEEPKKEEPVPEIQRNFPTVEFKKIRSKLFSINMAAPENEDAKFLPNEVKSKMNPELQNVYVMAADGNTWMSFKIDEKPIESVIINKGTDLFLQGNEIRMFLGNTNVTKIFYNNYLIDATTKTGVKSLVFPEESNSKYQLPLFPKAKDDILYTSEEYIKRMKLEEEELEKKKQ